MFRYTCLNPISEIGLERFNEAYLAVEDMKDADLVLVRSAKMTEMEIPRCVAAIGRAGAGVNNIPLELCSEMGTVVFNTPGANANGVKELVLAGMLLASRDIVGGVEWVKRHEEDPEVGKLAEKKKKAFSGCEISGKKLGIIGLGAIGQLVANAATHLGMTVYGYDPYISIDAAWNLSRSIHHIENIDDIYRECDYITVHVPLTDETRGMIGAEQIAMMKEGVVLLNFARDLLVDESALVEALHQGKLKKYVTDFANPTIAGAPNTLVTPHLGASTKESEDNCARLAVDEIRDFMENGNIRNSVNYPACDMGKPRSAGRLAICHRNVPHMISRFTGVISDDGVNISDLTNKSRAGYAYTLIDLASPATETMVGKLKEVNGVLRVRVIK